MTAKPSASVIPDWPSVLSGEVVVFGLLGKALYVYGDRVWLQSLANDDVFREVPFAANQPDVLEGVSALTGWSDKNRGGISDADYDGLLADYTRLFSTSFGPSFSPPWESVYCDEDELVFQKRTLQVRAWYRRFGLEPEKLHQEPDDHIGLELSFVAHLAAEALNALGHHNIETFGQTINAQRRFVSEHVLHWAPRWCEQVFSLARTDFYRGITQVTHGALRELATVLGLNVPKSVCGK